jgi:hypothetical protein
VRRVTGASTRKFDTLQNIEDLHKSIKLDVIIAFAFLEY